mmetsp:Transcript_11987/g.33722  ORF Transcript_11987/g.33722 Transcript_11987/m.33722 type:complete len:118 (+) Transcript_11987:310-663(+)
MSSKQLSKLFPQEKRSGLGVAKGRVGKNQIQPTAGAKEQSQPASSAQEHTEHVLRQFDLSSKYGPCIGMTRLERWERADKLGLDPPEAVEAILRRAVAESKRAEDCKENQCLWEGRV